MWHYRGDRAAEVLLLHIDVKGLCIDTQDGADVDKLLHCSALWLNYLTVVHCDRATGLRCTVTKLPHSSALWLSYLTEVHCDWATALQSSYLTVLH